MDEQANLKTMIKKLIDLDIQYIKFVIYYESDETHMSSDITVMGFDGKERNIEEIFDGPPPDYGESPDENDWYGVLWSLADVFGDNGVFQLNVRERTVHRIGDAYVPEDNDIEYTDLEPQEYKFEFQGDDGVFDGPYFPSWSQQDNESPYVSQFWCDPANFNPDYLWYVPKYKKLQPGEHGQWKNDEQNRDLDRAVARATGYYLQGSAIGLSSPDDPKLLEKINGDNKKGHTSARVINAWGEELFVISSKGKIRDKRGPFKIQIQLQKRGVLKVPEEGWVTASPNIPYGLKYPEKYETEYTSVVDAITMAKALLVLNTDNDFHLRVVDNKNRKAGFDHESSMNALLYSPQDIPVFVDKTKGKEIGVALVELSPDDLIGLGWEMRKHTQHLWVVEFSKRFYGDNVHKVSVDTESTYNDEGSYYDDLTGITAYDVDGRVVSYDRVKLLERFKEQGFYWDILVKSYKDACQKEVDKEKNPEPDWDNPETLTFNNQDFYDFAIELFLTEILEEEYGSVDAEGLAGDYFVSQDPVYDVRWSRMRIFSMVDK